MTLWHIFHLKSSLKITTKITLSFARIITRRFIASHDHQNDDDDDNFDARKSLPPFVFFAASKEWWYSLRSFSTITS